MTRRHRNEDAYPELWRAVSGQIRAAMNAHSDIEMPEKRIASIVKRVVGQQLALLRDVAGSGKSDGKA